MNTLKTVLAIIGLVLIGFVAGFFVHRQISKEMIREVSRMGQAKGLENHLLNRLQVDEEQKEILLPIIEVHSHKIDSLHRNLRRQRRLIIKDMHEEMKPHLNETQIEQLEEFNRRFRERGKKRRKKDLQQEKKQN